MAPTEILARQHFERMRPLAEIAGLRIALLTGRDKAAIAARNSAALAAGEIDLAVGTHALFQESVVFRDLGLAVVDEQHRFGVHQRLALGEQGRGGRSAGDDRDADPAHAGARLFRRHGRFGARREAAGPHADRHPRAADRAARRGRRRRSAARSLAGARAYWVCPLVEESEALDVAAAEERAEDLRAFFGDAVGLVHGRMKGPAKDAAMERFQRGETKVLVATTVIEVGVDVPEATIMVIEHAERFGLAQTHQLRGRVGRGAGRSTCLLLYKGPLGEAARARIQILRETEDGFRIAEEDLRLRGEGDVLGARQAGAPGFRLARLEVHGALLRLARAQAEAAVKRSERLAGEEFRGLRTLLYLFERDAAVRLLEAG